MKHWQKHCQGYRVVLLGAVILLAVFAQGCASVPIQTGTETVSFKLVKMDRTEYARNLGEAAGHAHGPTKIVLIPVRHGETPSVTEHTFTLHTYRKGPCPVACVIDGEVHSETEAWDGHRAAVAGDAVISATGADVGYNDAWILWHEIRHVRGFSH